MGPVIASALIVKGQVIAAVLALIVLVVVIRFVRKGLLRDTFGLIWVIVAIGTLAITLSPAAMWDRVAALLGIASGGTTLLIVLGLFGILLLIMQVSIALTRLERITTAAVIDRAVADVDRTEDTT